MRLQSISGEQNSLLPNLLRRPLNPPKSTHATSSRESTRKPSVSPNHRYWQSKSIALTPITTGACRTPRRRGHSQGPPATPTKYDNSPSRDLHDGYSSDTSFVPSSPITGTKDERTAKRNERKRETQRAALLKHYAQRRERNNWRENNTHHLDDIDTPLAGPSSLAAQPAAPSPTEDTPDRASIVFEDVLSRLQREGHTWGDLVEWISDSSSSCPARNRYDGFFKSKEQVLRVLSHWTSRQNCETGRNTLRDWATEYVGRLVAREGDEVTKSNMLQSHTMPFDKSFILGFSLVGLYQKLSTLCPVTTGLFHRLATTSRQELSMNENTEERKQHVSTYREYTLAT